MDSAVPVVDLEAWRSDPRNSGFVSGLGEALRSYGFVRVRGHGVSPDLIARSYAAAKAFFYQPREKKIALVVPGQAGQRGYTPFRAESAKYTDVPDLKEFFHVGRELDPEHSLGGRYVPNCWPEIQGFRETLLELYTALESVSKELLTALALHLDLDASHFVEMAVDGDSVLRLLHYPATDDTTYIPGAIRAAAHEDINFITLLLASTASGLELLRRDGSWIPVNAEKGELIVDSGDMMSRLTNGVIPATTHRVINPEDGTTERFSMPFFVHPRPEVSLATLPQFRGPGFPAPPRDLDARTYLLNRLESLGLGDL
ncbi:MAG: 2-oxoglutarate and iron-dependent oxygenase domain-containing protein [Myxococcota bacterium]|nr:2-oxoglutarate and iron-dependent oxygenase domain-containing protein [Myxococcota bacterium]